MPTQPARTQSSVTNVSFLPDRLERAAKLASQNSAAEFFIVASLESIKDTNPKLREMFLEELSIAIEKISARPGLDKNPERIFEEGMQELNDVLKHWLAAHPGAIDLPKSTLLVAMHLSPVLLMTGFGQVSSRYLHTEPNGDVSVHDLAKDLRADKPVAEKVFKSVIMGNLEPADVAFFGHGQLLRSIDREAFASMLENLPAASLSEKLDQLANERQESVLGIAIRVAEKANANQISSAKASVDELQRSESRTEAVLTSKSRTPKEGPMKTLGVFVLATLKSLIQILVSAALSVAHALRGIFHLGHSVVQKSKQAEAKEKSKTHFSKSAEHLKKPWQTGPKSAVITALIIVVAFAGGFIASRQYESAKATEAAKIAHENATKRLREATADAEAKMIYGDEEGARTKLAEIKALLATDAKLLEGASEVESANKTIAEVERSLRHETVITPEQFHALLEPGLRVFVAGGKDLVVSKSGKIFNAGEAVGSVSAPIEVLQTETGLISIDSKGNVTAIAADAKTKTYSGTATLEAKAYAYYANKLYAISKDGKIMRAALADDAVSEAKEWLKSASPKLSEATSLSIDSELYVGLKNGVAKYTRGVEEDLPLAQVDPALSKVAKVWTSIDTRSLWVFEPELNRLTLYSKKDNSLSRQYTWKDLGNITDFAVDETAKKIYLISGNTILTSAY